ncbi:MAG TPA: hypothetical protein VE262_01020 [Blastocatellia bacterium]|nr:hypothetical protein [Blastocatellia bacterium]
MSSRFYSVVAIISLILSPAVFGPHAAQNNPRIELAVDTLVPYQDGLLVLYGGLRLGGEKGLPVGAGDINGDGRADVMFCALYGSTGDRRNNGRVNIYLSDGKDTGVVEAGQQPPSISWIDGANSGDLLGTSVATGDVNGDGFKDMALGAFGDDGPGNTREQSGAIYVVLGAQDFNMRGDLGSPTPPPGVITIYGAQQRARAGIWVDLGDIDDDGFADIAVGADQISTPGEEHRGGAWVIFGQPNLPPVIDLASPPPGVRMTTILGTDREDHWGSMLHIGDINTDGIDDLAIAGAVFRDSAGYVSPGDEDSGHNAQAADFFGTRRGCGEVIVLYGSSNWPQSIDLSNPPANSTHVIGENMDDMLGSQMHSADLNGDGRRDFIVGALQGLAPNSARTGSVFIIYGAPGLEGATVDLAQPAPAGLNIVRIYGEAHLDCAGDSVRSFDINRDGLSDLFIGSPEHTFDVNGQTRTDAGDTKFIFGQREPLPPVIKLYDQVFPAGIRVFRLAGGRGDEQGADGDGDEMSYRLTGGDVDGDGFVDYIANAMHGNGFDQSVPNGGNVYIFSGRKLSASLGMLPVNPDPAPALTSASLSRGGQPVQEAGAGEANLRVVVTGTGFRPDTEILINNVPVVSRIPNDPQLAATQRIVELDENPAIRNSVGQLMVRARHTSPASDPSNEVTGGRLVGPQIERVKVKRKASGLRVVVIIGVNFQAGSAVSVTTGGGQAVTLQSTAVESSTTVRVRIGAGSAPAPGTLLRVRVIGPGGIQSNEVVATAR